MKSNAILGAVIGFAAGTAAAIAGKVGADFPDMKRRVPKALTFTGSSSMIQFTRSK